MNPAHPSFHCALVSRAACIIRLVLGVGAGTLGVAHGLALDGGPLFVSEQTAPGALVLARDGQMAPLVADAQDHIGVLRAVRSLRADVERVTGVAPAIDTTGVPRGTDVVLVGTIGRSALIDGLVKNGKLDVAPIVGRWEAFLLQVVENPTAGVERALVIAGSDKRGTIYGVYTLSEQIGVSPWYWWADVPVQRRALLCVPAGTRVVDDGPTVKYRGIFLNDEAPALTGWVGEKFGGFNHQFYEHVFELLLRLRANYIWPAMWEPRAFNDDDPLNPALADEMGIVMGTSHHEPMMRAHNEWRRFGKGPWNYAQNDAALREFWRGGVERVKDYEQIVSLGMRGDGDEAMSEETNTALLERIVADQRKILAEVVGRPLPEIPQLWALYKEVQSYYEHGMRVPDDVTLLWCDDNWGNIRRLPLPAERKRPGGAGVYYHFDYVGGPRNYKWLNTVPIAKVWEQMHLAWRYEATRIWIVNVGDLKPMEFPIEFFLTYAWDPERWPYERLTEFSERWAAREFGVAQAGEIAALVNGYTRLNGRRKPEMLAPDTYSLTNHREAERVLGEWRDLVERAEAVNSALDPAARAAFFQLVLFPVQACANLQELHVAAGLNALYARQGRASANELGERARELFRRDEALTREWDAMLDGKWRHMMDQVHIGYTSWQQPVCNAMPAVTEIHVPAAGRIALAVEGDTAARPGDYPVSAVATLPPLASFSGQSRWIDVFNRGQAPVGFSIEASEPWLRVEPASGEVGPDVRIEVSADWSRVPPGEHRPKLTVKPADGSAPLVVAVPVSNPPAAGVAGFVETDRHIAIEAPNFSRAVGDADVAWRTLPGHGRTLGGVTTFPVTAATRKPGGASPRLDYDVHFFSAGEVTVELHCAPSLDFQSGEGLKLAVSFDDALPQIVKLDTWATLQTWEKAVGDGVRRVTTKHTITKPGPHVLKFWMVTPGVVLQRIVIDCGPSTGSGQGGVRPSYLGPPESPRIPAVEPAPK